MPDWNFEDDPGIGHFWPLIDEKDRPELLVIFGRKEDSTSKMKLVRAIDSIQSEVLKLIHEFLVRQDAKMATAEDFLKLLSKDDREIAEMRINKLNMKGLEELISGLKNDAVTKAFTNYKKTQRQKDKEKIDGQMKFKDTVVNIAAPHEIFEKLPQQTNILILGASGTGKSTFINSFVNYMKFAKLEDAEKGELDILIKVHFNEADNKMRRAVVTKDPTIDKERGAAAENEHAETGESATQFPRSYMFSWGPKGKEKLIRIIDTPGVGDSRGTLVDSVNMDRIMGFISNFKELHAICILLKASQNRATLEYQYCLKELLTKLHVSACKNIFFFITHATATSGPGDSIALVERFIKEIAKEKADVNIKIDETTCFSFDNQAFRYLCAAPLMNKIYTDTEMRGTKECWKMSSESAIRFLGKLAGNDFKPHNIADTLSITKVRGMIFSISKPLAEISRAQLINMKLIDDKSREIKQIKNAKLEIDQVELVLEELEHPTTVCTSPKCVKYVDVNTSIGSISKEIVYVQHCHPNCTRKCMINHIPDPAVKECCMLRNRENCYKCSCTWDYHMHITYKQHIKMTKIAADRNAVKQFILKIEKRRKDLEEEAKKIKEYCADFAKFLKSNSIIAINDAYAEYMEHLIREEENKVTRELRVGDTLNELRQHKAEYEEYIKRVNENSTAPPKSLGRIEAMMKELMNLEFSGPYIKKAMGTNKFVENVKDDTKNSIFIPFCQELFSSKDPLEIGIINLPNKHQFV